MTITLNSDHIPTLFKFSLFAFFFRYNTRCSVPGVPRAFQMIKVGLWTNLVKITILGRTYVSMYVDDQLAQILNQTRRGKGFEFRVSEMTMNGRLFVLLYHDHALIDHVKRGRMTTDVTRA